MDLIAHALTLGTATTIITEIFKLAPFFSRTSRRKAITAIVVLTAVNIYYAGTTAFESWEKFASLFFLSLSFAFVAYKTIIQPIVVTTVEDITNA